MLFKQQTRSLIHLLRPRQWIKNSFVIAPLAFTGLFLDTQAIFNTAVATILFCLASSASYIINDIHDLESDRQHPQKSKTRPLASGELSVSQALVLLSILIIILLAASLHQPKVMLVIAAYLALNAAYTFYLKHQPILDIFSIAAGFVLRVYAGATALAVPLSSWMFVTTLCVALFLAAIKRRQELLLSGSSGRSVLKKYNAVLMERYAQISAVGALLFYSMYVISTQPQMVITIPLVLFGLFRYWFMVEMLDDGESPTDAILKDWPLIATLILWIAASAYVLRPN